MASQRIHQHSRSLTKRLQLFACDRTKDSLKDLKSLRAQICNYDLQLKQLEADRTNLRSISPFPAKRKSVSPGKKRLRAPRPKSALVRCQKKQGHKSHESLPIPRDAPQTSARSYEAKEIQTTLPDEDMTESFETFGTKKPEEPTLSIEISKGNITSADESLQPYISLPQQLRKSTKSNSLDQAVSERNSTLLDDESAELLGLMTDKIEKRTESSLLKPVPKSHFQGTKETGVLRTSLEQSLMYQDCLYTEVERIKELFESEKQRWKQQIKRLKDEQQLEIEAVRASYEDQLRTYRSQESKVQAQTMREQDYGQLLEMCEKEKSEIRLNLETQNKLALDLLKEQLRTEYQQELDSYKQQLNMKHDEEENFLQEQLLQRLQMNENRVRTQVKQELEDVYQKERATRDREYELILKARINALKTDYDRRIKDLQDQNSALRREKLIDVTGEKRAVLEELETGKTNENNPVLCSKCSALLQVSRELSQKRSKLMKMVDT